MYKEAAKARMEAFGYRVAIIGGVVTVLLSAEEYRDHRILRQIGRAFKEIGYDQSRGVKVESGKAIRE